MKQIYKYISWRVRLYLIRKCKFKNRELRNKITTCFFSNLLKPPKHDEYIETDNQGEILNSCYIFLVNNSFDYPAKLKTSAGMFFTSAVKTNANKNLYYRKVSYKIYKIYTYIIYIQQVSK